MAHTACLVCLISTVSGRIKKRNKKANNSALVAGTQQTLSNLFLQITEFNLYIFNSLFFLGGKVEAQKTALRVHQDRQGLQNP